MSGTVTFDIDGTDALIEKLREMGRKGTQAANEALWDAAEPILHAAQANARRQLTERSRKGIAGIKIGRITTRGGRKEITIGIGKGDISEIYYMKFHEFGTSRQNQFAFLLPAYHAEKDTAYSILREKLREAVKP